MKNEMLRDFTKNFTGISSPYETPEHPEVTIDTTGKSLADSVDYVMAQLEDLLN